MWELHKLNNSNIESIQHQNAESENGLADCRAIIISQIHFWNHITQWWDQNISHEEWVKTTQILTESEEIFSSSNLPRIANLTVM